MLSIRLVLAPLQRRTRIPTATGRIVRCVASYAVHNLCNPSEFVPRSIALALATGIMIAMGTGAETMTATTIATMIDTTTIVTAITTTMAAETAAGGSAAKSAAKSAATMRQGGSVLSRRKSSSTTTFSTLPEDDASDSLKLASGANGESDEMLLGTGMPFGGALQPGREI